MTGIHVRLDLENEAGQRLLHRGNHPLIGLARQRRRREAHELVQQFLDPEIGQRRSEKYRRLPRGEVLMHVELRAGAAHELDLVTKCLQVVAERCRSFVRAKTVHDSPLAGTLPLPSGVQIDSVLVQVIHALE